MSRTTGGSGRARYGRRAGALGVLLCYGLFALAAQSADDAPAVEAPGIGPTALQHRIERKDASLIALDVRTPEEFAAGHVPGAINIPYTHLPARIAELPYATGKDVVVYCAIGARSRRAIERLREHGFTRLLHLDGDMRGWQAQRRPVEP